MPRPLRPLLPLVLTALAALACERDPDPGLRPFHDFRASTGAKLATPVTATPAQRRHDARSRDAWRRILDRLEVLVREVEDGKKLCGPRAGGADPGADAGPDPRTRPDPAGFDRLRSRLEAEGERLQTDIAQLDPTGSASALFLPARRLNRLVGTVLLSTLEISCGTMPVLDSRLAAARRQLREMRDYLDGL